MSTEKTTDLLNVYVLHRPESVKLDNLENDVWRKIANIKAEQVNSWPRYRYATVVLALILGLTAGEFGKLNEREKTSPQMLNLQVFKALDGNLPSNKIAGNI